MAHIKNLDINLLVVMDALFRHQNLSQAAKELGVTQSALSHSLTKLRIFFNDQLFVRVSKGVKPTNFAKNLKPEIDKIVNLSNIILEKSHSQKIEETEITINIASTEYFEIVIGHQLVNNVKKIAPKVKISFRPASGKLPKEELENSIVDIAIAGFFYELPDGFFKQQIFKDSFKTAYRNNNSLIKKKLTKEQFYTLDHAIISLQGDLKDNNAQNIDGKKYSREFKFGTSSFSSIAWYLAQNDCLLTAPSKLLDSFQKYFPITISECPITIKPIEVVMVWHGLTHQSAIHRLIRQEIKNIANEIFISH